MDYQRIYNEFIADRSTKEQALIASGQYKERHHIIPRSMGGTDEKENLISLTAYDHYFVHLIYAKIHNTPKAWFAVKCMLDFPGNNKKRLSKKLDGSMIEFARVNSKKAMSEIMKEKHREGWRHHTTDKSIKKRTKSFKYNFSKLSDLERIERSKNVVAASQRDEVKEKQRLITQARWDSLNGNLMRHNLSERMKKNNPMFNEDTRKVISERMREYSLLPEVKMARSKAIVGEKNPSKRPEVAQKIKEACSKRDMSKNGLEKKVINLDTKEVFKSVTVAGQSIDKGGCKIGCVCRGKRKTASGYRWAYVG